MSEAPDDHRPTRAGTAWFRVNLAILAVVVLWAANLPLGVFHAALNGGTYLPSDFANYLVAYTWSLVGPLALLNVFWLIYAARRRRERPAVPEPPRQDPEQSPHPPERGCSAGVALLSLAAFGLLCCRAPEVLWFQLGTYYGAGHYGVHGTLSAGFLHWNRRAVWSAVGLLSFCNLVWLIYALVHWSTREIPPEPPPPAIPEGAGDHFPKQPPSPHVKPGDGVREGP